MMVSSLPPHAMFDVKTSHTRIHEKPVWNHALRVSSDHYNTDVGILRDTEVRSLSEFSLEALARTSSGQHPASETSPNRIDYHGWDRIL